MTSQTHETPQAPPIEEYYRFDFVTAEDQGIAMLRLFNYLAFTEGSAADGPDRPVVWTTLLSAPNAGLYLSPGAVRAAFLAAIPLRTFVRVPESQLPEDLVLVYGRDDDHSVRKAS